MIGAKYASDLQGHENDRMRAYNRDMALEMYGLENKRADAVWEREKAYNADLWAKQNEYNSPKAQMQRLSDAGLNPNLMYGQGTTGVSSPPPVARLESGSIDTPDYGPADPRGDYLMQGIKNYVSMRNADLMAQNMAVQNDLIESQTESVKETAKKTRAERRGVERENKLLGEKVSARDPWWARMGGRLLKWLRNETKGVRSSIADEAIKTKPFFDPAGSGRTRR